MYRHPGTRGAFDEQNQTKLQLLKESQGQPPDKAKIDQLQRETLAKVIRLLTPSQQRWRRNDDEHHALPA
jgi:hypothetical protein